MKKKPRASQTKAPTSALKNLSPTDAGAVKGGKIGSQLKSPSVNPIVVSRDRSLNS